MKKLTCLIVALVGALALSAGASAGTTEHVINGLDAGPGSLRAAVEAANGDESVDKIRFDEGLTVNLQTPVVYDGDQDLSIDGNGSTVSGASGNAAANTTWDGGLLVSHSGADLSIRELAFADSFNNGVAVFIPASTDGVVSVELVDVSITDAKFHGLFVDGQDSTGTFNTDDVPHGACNDPHPFDSDASIQLLVRSSAIEDNGTLAGGFNDSLASGCPRDFDGVRVDDGGLGGITATLLDSDFDGNLADGAELDEKGDGGVEAWVARSSFDENGDSGQTVDGLTDLDDGFDIDEEGPGDLVARVSQSTLNDNFDEGLDLDEAGAGNADVRVTQVIADGNEDQGLKIDEEDGGSLTFYVTATSASDSLSQDGIETTEADDGDLDVRVVNSDVTGNDDAGVKVEQGGSGAGTLRVVNSDLSANNNGAVDAAGVDVELVNTIG